MTIRERIEQALQDDSGDKLNQLIRLAYYLGREQVAAQICDEHNRRMAAIRGAASKCRYYHMAHKIINAGQTVRQDLWTVRDNLDAIYHPDYAGDYAGEFCSDTWEGAL